MFCNEFEEGFWTSLSHHPSYICERLDGPSSVKIREKSNRNAKLVLRMTEIERFAFEIDSMSRNREMLHHSGTNRRCPSQISEREKRANVQSHPSQSAIVLRWMKDILSYPSQRNHRLSIPSVRDPARRSVSSSESIVAIKLWMYRRSNRRCGSTFRHLKDRTTGSKKGIRCGSDPTLLEQADVKKHAKDTLDLTCCDLFHCVDVLVHGFALDAYW